MGHNKFSYDESYSDFYIERLCKKIVKQKNENEWLTDKLTKKKSCETGFEKQKELEYFAVLRLE